MDTTKTAAIKHEPYSTLDYRIDNLELTCSKCGRVSPMTYEGRTTCCSAQTTYRKVSKGGKK